MFAIAAIAVFLQPPCRADGLPMAYLRTAGPAADPVTRLQWGLIAISLLVVVIVTGLVLLACLRRRRPRSGAARAADLPGEMPLEPDVGGTRWITVGVGISAVVLLGSVVWTLATLSAIAAPTAEPALTVELHARQFWWEARYPGTPKTPAFVTANEIHIPVGVPVAFTLIGDDVIHSFWVPRLGGKTDMIPGRINHAWLQADAPGVYRGQCAEFCGPQHARMGLRVIADAPAQFDAWRRRQPSWPSGVPRSLRPVPHRARPERCRSGRTRARPDPPDEPADHRRRHA
jgi:cytochrome c oxidase subunit 2